MGEPTRKAEPSNVSVPTFRLSLIPGGLAQTQEIHETHVTVAPPPPPPLPTAPLAWFPEVSQQILPAAEAVLESLEPIPAIKPPSNGTLVEALQDLQKPPAPLESTLRPPPPTPTGPIEITPTLAAVVPTAVAYQFRCFPFYREGEWLWLATDSSDRETVAAEVTQATGLSTIVGETDARVVDAVLDAQFGATERRSLWLRIEVPEEDLTVHRAVCHTKGWAGFRTSGGVLDQVGDIMALTRACQQGRWAPAEATPATVTDTSPAAKLVSHLMKLALDVGASDIHIEPQEHAARVRIRLDGVLQPLADLPLQVLPQVTGRIKVLGELNLVEKRLPQEGRIQFNSEGRRIDIRVSTMPVVHGEGLVMRVLDSANLRTKVQDLGLEGDDLARVQRCLRGPRGLVLATGPTGSGKSTTLYSMASELNDSTRKIVTIEDPVEYFLPGLQQIQVQHHIGLTFDRVIRSTLRQDPDVILVGEIRDSETAKAAVKAALTGHLVLSSLHTADAASAVARLLDLGVEPGMCCAALRLVIGQRLVRTLCNSCRAPIQPDRVHRLLTLAEIDPTAAEMSYEPIGCIECRGTGYQGRRAVFEVMDFASTKLRRLVQAASSADAMRITAEEEGMTALRDAALNVVRNGETSIEEALRVVWLD